jgi:hypothetical protein
VVSWITCSGSSETALFSINVAQATAFFPADDYHAAMAEDNSRFTRMLKVVGAPSKN